MMEEVMKKGIVLLLAVVLVATTALAAEKAYKAITAENQWTDSIRVRNRGVVVIEDTGSISATFTLQIKPKDGSSYVTTGDTFTAAGAWAFDAAGELYRIGVATGDFTSGTATVYIQEQED